MRYAVVRNSEVLRLTNRLPDSLTEDEAKGRGILPVVVSTPDHDPVTQYLEPRPLAEWAVEAGQVRRTFHVHDYDLETERRRKHERIRELRKRAEYAGITAKLPGDREVFLRTLPTSQAKISGAMLSISSGLVTADIDWESLPGQWETLSALETKAGATAVAVYVQACYSNAKALDVATDQAADLYELAAINEHDGWPDTYRDVSHIT